MALPMTMPTTAEPTAKANQPVTAQGAVGLWPLSGLPVVGGLFRQNPVAFLTPFIFLAVVLFLNRSAMGLKLRAVGENPAMVDAAGISVAWLRYRAVLLAVGPEIDVEAIRLPDGQPLSASGSMDAGMSGGVAARAAQTADALRYLETQPASEYDVVFLDPPFNQNLLPAVCTLLEERQWLADDSWINTESETAPSTLGLPGNWRLHREQKSGRVYYALWQRMAVIAG